jgi:hypothetical protein
MNHVKAQLAMKVARRNADRLRSKPTFTTLDTEGNKVRSLGNDPKVRADYSAAIERISALEQQDIDPVIRNYRIFGAMPNLPIIERIVRGIAVRYGLDESELWADTMDNICEDTSWPIPTNPGHFRRYVSKRATRIATTGHHRKNRIKSKLTLPISGLERQENSPSYNPYIGEKGQSLPAFSADRVHYIGHKAPGNPALDAFNKSGRIDQYLRDKGLDNLSELLHNSVVWYRSKGEDRPAHWGINWTGLGRQLGLNTRSEVNKLRASVTELLSNIPDEYCRDNWRFQTVKTGRVPATFPDMTGVPIFSEGRSVATAEWKVTHKKANALFEHYRENVGHGNCAVCRQVQETLDRWLTTSETLRKHYQDK